METSTALPEIANQNSSFEEQFQNREQIQVLDTTVDTVDIRPEVMRDETPVLFVPGWSETLNTYKGGLREMNRHGRRVISLEHPRRGVVGEHITNEGERKAEATKAVFGEYFKEGQVDIVGHSEGSVSALMTAAEYPEKVRNIVLVNPAGLIGKDKFLRLTTSFGKMLGQDYMYSAKSLLSKNKRGEFARNYLGNTTRESLKYMAKNPRRALSEAKYLINSDVVDLVKTLGENGVGVSIIAHAGDPVFPVDRMKKVAMDCDLVQFHTITGSHNGLNSRPDIYMPEVTSALERMQTFREIGKDNAEMIGDKIVMKDHPVIDDTERLNKIREDLGININKVKTEELGN